MKRSFFQAAATSILLYGCTTWTLTKRLEKKLDGNYTRMLRAILNKSWRQHPTRHQLYGHLPPITKTIQVRRTRHAGHCWRSRDELIRDVLLWTPTHGRAKAGRPAWTYIQQLCEDTGCCPEDLPRAMNDREEWRERVRDIRTTSATWWWWYMLGSTQRKWLLPFWLTREWSPLGSGGRLSHIGRRSRSGGTVDLSSHIQWLIHYHLKRNLSNKSVKRSTWFLCHFYRNIHRTPILKPQKLVTRSVFFFLYTRENVNVKKKRWKLG